MLDYLKYKYVYMNIKKGQIFDEIYLIALLTTNSNFIKILKKIKSSIISVCDQHLEWALTTKKSIETNKFY